MGFDDFIVGNIDRKRVDERRQSRPEAPKASNFEEAHTRARLVLSNRDYSIQAPEFIDLYGQENVMNDMRRVKEKRDSFRSTETPASVEAKQAAEVFEAIVLEHAELSNWLGENVSLLKTSLFDDYFNGTDVIAEWTEEGKESNVLALAVDVTFGVQSIEKKLNHVRRDVERGQLGSIRYFKNSDGSFRGERNNIPHVVIGVSKHTVKELAELWMRDGKAALAAHPVQRAMLDEMYEQLKAIQTFAVSRGRMRVAEAYGRSLMTVEKIRNEKVHVPLAHLEHDRVYEELLIQTRAIFQT